VDLIPLSGACARFTDGGVACWNNGFEGLGVDVDGEGDRPVSEPPRVELPAATLSLTVSSSAVCTITVDSELYCWGDNSSGQLGYGNTDDVGDDETPLEVGPVDLGAAVVDVAMSQVGSACALLSGGGVRCWGNNENAQLGYPDLYTHEGDYQNLGDDELPISVGLVDVGGLAVAVGVSNRASCAVLDDGSVRCWGRNFTTPEGDWVGADSPPSTAPAFTTDEPIVDIEVEDNWICVLTVAGAVHCWGGGVWERGYGGAPDGEDANIETLAEAPAISLGRPATSIAMASNGACALLDDGTLRCWGAASMHGHGIDEELGDFEVPSDWPPVPVFEP
jgi:alpha-tubulin suppressor-like RCC1 family protein